MSKSATDSMSGQADSVEANEPQEDDVETLEELRPVFEHNVVQHGKVPVSKRMQVEPDNGAISEADQWGRPYYNDVEITSYSCNECALSFDTKEEVESHLRDQVAQYRSRWVLPGLPRESYTDVAPNGWTDETAEVLCGVIQECHSHAYGRVKEGLDHYIALARDTFSIPPNYEWEDWDAYEDGSLTFPDGTPMYRQSILTKAVQELSKNFEHPYMTEAFTFHLLPEGLGLIHAFGDAIVIAPVVHTFETEDE